MAVVPRMLAGLRPAPPRAAPRWVALLGAAHLGPTLAVTTVVALLATSTDLEPGAAVLVTAGVLTGQLTIGWGNDLLDASRDRAVGRADKPLASGRVSADLVRRCLVVAAASCIVLSLLAGWRSGVVHLGLGVSAGHLYNAWWKATRWSWLPYAVAFGTLPAVVTLAGATPRWPPLWMLVTAGVLGVGAHFLNTLPDLADDAITGVQGLPHLLGTTRTRIVGTLLLVVGSVVAVLGPPGQPTTAGLAALGIVVVVSLVAFIGRGRTPFYAAMAIALVDVVLLVVNGG